MNYLAHAYLSFSNPSWVVGNLLSDFVKGKKKFDYPPLIQQGFALHRAIDAFTDAHPAVKSAKEPFRQTYRLYSGAIIDICFDYFLANDPLHFGNANHLKQFTGQVYKAVSKNIEVIPEAQKSWFKRMATDDWLYNYQFKWGIGASFGGLVYRSKYLTDSAPAMEIFEAHYDFLRECYTGFFPELYTFARLFAQQQLKEKL